MSIEHALIEHCSPTLASLKVGSMFGFLFPCRDELHSEIRSLNTLLTEKGLLLFALRADDSRALCYLYWVSQLAQMLADPQNAAFLREQGYEDLNSKCVLRTLCRRLCFGSGFPHEIGLFLGYPPWRCDRLHGKQPACCRLHHRRNAVNLLALRPRPMPCQKDFHNKPACCRLHHWRNDGNPPALRPRPMPCQKDFHNKGKNCLCCGCWKAYTNACAAQKQFDRLNKCTAVYCRLYDAGRPLNRLTVAA